MRTMFERRFTVRVAGAGAALLIGLSGQPARSAELLEGLTLDIAATAIYHAGDLEPVDDTDQLTGVIDGTLTYRPTNRDTFSSTASFAENNALNDEVPVSLAPFADDLEAALENVSNRDRDYLLTAWYRRDFDLGPRADFAFTGGLIDTTGYLDQNAYANDEVGQFQNDIFVNNTLLNLPSYDFGTAAEFSFGERWSATAVWFNGETQRAAGDRSFNYFGGQVGWHPTFEMGKGNYRAIAYTTDENFAAVGGGSEQLTGFGLSLDQSLGKIVGAFARAGWQDDDAAVAHDAHVSGGMEIGGNLWGRPQDNAGVGLAYLSGADGSGIDETYAAEGYVKFGVTEWADVSLDGQYIEDNLNNAADAEALIGSVRVNLIY